MYEPPQKHKALQTKSTNPYMYLKILIRLYAFSPTEKRDEIITGIEKTITQTIVIIGNKYDLSERIALKGVSPLINPIITLISEISVE